ncbi:MAG: diacylglycerol kinase family lipid kinase [Desulfomonile tiedjei]|uniref:Diacylglycerol kinase family lipid kinase n=1 Tax=Desulfomonile tiedjei TaxID=2358 RepID=A0A9D6V1I5_9BACT|nr:diacylglycerol kinase family lipid kinase [Desulfomonile tiedjei]
MKILVIGNPISGKGNAKRQICEFVRVLERRGHHVEVFMTSSAGEALRRARSINSGTEALVAAGGDGTVNEILNGLSDPSAIPILHLPVGTANQLAMTLGLPHDPEKLAAILEAKLIRCVDLGVAGSRRFLMVLSAGFDARVAEEINRHRGIRLGYSGYVFPILKTAAGHRPAKLEVVVDDHRKIVGSEVMVLKVRLYGGLLVFADDARLDSGHFHVCVFREGTLSGLFLYASAGLMRMASHIPGIVRTIGRRVRIRSEEPVPVELDGESFGTTPLDIRLEPSVVPLIVPAVQDQPPSV